MKMQTIPQHPLPRASRCRGTFLALLAACLAASLAATHAAAPTLQPLVPAKWPSSGNARGVAVSGHYAYVADYTNGLQVIDVRNPATCVRVGGYNTSGFARDVAVSGHYAYVADETAGLQVIDVSNPTNCVRVGGYDTRRYAWGVAVVAGRIYVTEEQSGGLLVLPTIHNVQFTVRVEATPGVPLPSKPPRTSTTRSPGRRS